MGGTTGSQLALDNEPGPEGGVPVLKEEAPVLGEGLLLGGT
jgi:hypothetical protein